MNENQAGQSDLLDTTDCLEAIGVFRQWKNFFFIIVILSLLVLQVCFWVVNTGYIAPSKEYFSGKKAEGDGPAAVGGLDKTVEQSEPVEADAQEPAAESAGVLFGITFKHLAKDVSIANAVLVLMGILYCLTMLFALKVSLVGRIGGINHICRAFFLSLIMLVLLLPWQKVFGSVVLGAIYTPRELAKWGPAETDNIIGIVLCYLRFSGYWLLILLLLIFSQLRSGRWSKAVLRRLEVI